MALIKEYHNKNIPWANFLKSQKIFWNKEPPNVKDLQ